MTAVGRTWLMALACTGAVATAAHGDGVRFEEVDGIRYQVVERTVQVPVTEMRDQQQTIYRQQVTTDTIQHQQLYTVPVTQYQLISRLHGRWNPFITPYWTHHYQPVTTWTQQVGTVQIPVNRVAWAPETRTVQAPTTTYRTAKQESRIPVGAALNAAGSQPMLASRGPSATLTPQSPATMTPAAAPAATAYGGVAMSQDPPRQGTGVWRAPTPATTGTAATAAAPAPANSYR